MGYESIDWISSTGKKFFSLNSIGISIESFKILTYNGFYDDNLEFVNLENIQIVGSMNPTNTLGRHKLSTRFTSIVRICSINYPNEDQLQIIYANYLQSILQQQLSNHKVWSSHNKVHQLAVSMIHVYNEVGWSASLKSKRNVFFSRFSCDRNLVKMIIVIICLHPEI